MIIGSTAAKHWNINRCEPKDVDQFFYDGVEPEGDSHKIPEDLYRSIPQQDGYITPDALYTLKCSHFAWDIHWEKTKSDILWYKSKGCKLIPELYTKLVKYWEQEHGDKSYLCLNRKKDDFFNDFVDYVYDHDYLHEIVALPNKPVYSRCLKDGQDVLIDYDKFCSMSEADKVRMFREEITVIAAERWLLPEKSRGKLSWVQTYHLSLKKTITRLTKNWACDYIIHNLDKFVVPDYPYFKNLFETLGELDMSEVDVKMFEDIAQELEMEVSEFVFNCCEGEPFEDIKVQIKTSRPVQGNRNYNDPEYQEEMKSYRDELRKEKNRVISSLGIEYEHLDQDGGGEGGAEYCYGVFSLNGKIYRADYSYYSYNGYEYDYIMGSLREVKPVQKTITVYE